MKREITFEVTDADPIYIDREAYEQFPDEPYGEPPWVLAARECFEMDIEEIEE